MGISFTKPKLHSQVKISLLKHLSIYITPLSVFDKLMYSFLWFHWNYFKQYWLMEENPVKPMNKCNRYVTEYLYIYVSKWPDIAHCDSNFLIRHQLQHVFPDSCFPKFTVLEHLDSSKELMNRISVISTSRDCVYNIVIRHV